MEIIINQIIKSNDDKFRKINIKKVFKLMIYNIYIFLIYILFKLYIIHFLFNDSLVYAVGKLESLEELFIHLTTKEQDHDKEIIESVIKRVFIF